MNNILNKASYIGRELLTTIGNDDTYTQITSVIIDLCNTINTSVTDEFIWGEDLGHCSLDELITGAYWHYTEWHGGQDSIEYLALSVLGTIYQPGMETPDTDNDVYMQLDTMASEYWDSINRGDI